MEVGCGFYYHKRFYISLNFVQQNSAYLTIISLIESIQKSLFTTFNDISAIYYFFLKIKWWKKEKFLYSHKSQVLISNASILSYHS